MTVEQIKATYPESEWYKYIGKECEFGVIDTCFKNKNACKHCILLKIHDERYDKGIADERVRIVEQLEKHGLGQEKFVNELDPYWKSAMNMVWKIVKGE